MYLHNLGAVELRRDLGGFESTSREKRRETRVDAVTDSEAVEWRI